MFVEKNYFWLMCRYVFIKDVSSLYVTQNALLYFQINHERLLKSKTAWKIIKITAIIITHDNQKKYQRKNIFVSIKSMI